MEFRLVFLDIPIGYPHTICVIGGNILVSTVVFDCFECTQWLLEKRIDTSKKLLGSTALQFAQKLKRHDMCELLEGVGIA